MPGRVVVVGLGPAGADLVVPAARTALTSAARRFVRTVRHPAAAELAASGITFESFDDVYDAAPDLETTYRTITATLLDAAREVAESVERAAASQGMASPAGQPPPQHGSFVAYAVPGSPTTAERTMALLREAARRGAIHLDVVPGLSFADLAWIRLGVDPLSSGPGGARVADGRALTADVLDIPGPLLVAQCDSALVLGDVKLVLLERLDPATPVTVLRHLGAPDEAITEVPLAALDRVEPDHLTSLFVELPSAGPVEEYGRLLRLAHRLRAPGGCPWDAEQTHHSLTRYLLEEAYEVVEAVEMLPPGAPDGVDADHPAYTALVDELGDLLYQVIFHALLAEEVGAFTMADVARRIHDKLVRRHPHVFGDVDATTSEVVIRNWEQIKLGEKGSESLVAGITPGLPSLLYTHKLYRKAASVGLSSGDRSEAMARIEAAVRSLAAPEEDSEQVLAELLAATVAYARAANVDAESLLRGWAARFRARFEAMETLARERGVDLALADAATVATLWDDTQP